MGENMNLSISCLEVARKGEEVRVLDTKVSRQRSEPTLGLLAVYSVTAYEDRLRSVIDQKDAREMFDTPDQYANLTPGELAAFTAYALAGRLSSLDDGDAVTAYENMRDLTDEEQAVFGALYHIALQHQE